LGEGEREVETVSRLTLTPALSRQRERGISAISS
jgi:hypothetical protein